MHKAVNQPKPSTKVTIHLPAELLKKARKSTGLGITETVRRGLELLAAAEAYDQLRSLRGKIDLKIDLSSMRED